MLFTWPHVKYCVTIKVHEHVMVSVIEGVPVYTHSIISIVIKERES